MLLRCFFDVAYKFFLPLYVDDFLVLFVYSVFELLDVLQEKGAVLVGTSKNLYKAKCELKHDKKSYSMEYYFREKHTGILEIRFHCAYLFLVLPLPNWLVSFALNR